MLDDTYQLRAELEEGIRKVFAAMDIVALTRANAPQKFQQATPRVEIKCSLGRANGHRHICPDGITRFDRWALTVAVQCITRPANDGASALHDIFCARVRGTCDTIAQITWTDHGNFPNTRIAEPLRPAGENSTLKSQEGIEYTVLSHSGTLCIRESAWPVLPPVPPPPGGNPLLDTAGEEILDTAGQPILGF